MEGEGQGPGGGRRLFWRGFLTGLAVMGVLVAGTVGIMLRRGVTVVVPTAAVTERINREVQTAVRREMPRVVADLQRDVPPKVAAEAARMVAGLRLDLGGFEVPVPPQVVSRVEQAVQQAMQAGLEASVKQIDYGGLSRRLGDQAALMAERQLREQIGTKPLTVQVGPWQVPVRLILR